MTEEMTQKRSVIALLHVHALQLLNLCMGVYILMFCGGEVIDLGTSQLSLEMCSQKKLSHKNAEIMLFDGCLCL